MNKLTIVTNRQPRELLALCDLPEKARKDFDYIEDEDQFSSRLFAYRGHYYDVCEFMRTPDNEPARQELNELSTWDGYASDSYFSGVVVKYVDDCERVIVGRYYS